MKKTSEYKNMIDEKFKLLINTIYTNNGDERVLLEKALLKDIANSIINNIDNMYKYLIVEDGGYDTFGTSSAETYIKYTCPEYVFRITYKYLSLFGGSAPESSWDYDIYMINLSNNLKFNKYYSINTNDDNYKNNCDDTIYRDIVNLFKDLKEYSEKKYTEYEFGLLNEYNLIGYPKELIHISDNGVINIKTDKYYITTHRKGQFIKILLEDIRTGKHVESIVIKNKDVIDFFYDTAN